jgi:ubiquinone/menaquinone biosynthesis C-methylase UbiE
MILKDAIELIEHDWINDVDGPQTWADLGCGEGLFSQALAHLLEPGSHIYAVDKTKPASIPSYNNVLIESRIYDFIKDGLVFPPLDGILMANSLHYVSDKKTLLNKLKLLLKPAAGFIIVEYDTDTPIQNWVPYPLSFQSLQNLFRQAGYDTIVPIGKRASVYGRANLYSALIKKKA